MTNSTIGSVSRWILGARQGDPVAIDQIVSRYFTRVASCAHAMLKEEDRALSDGEDIAVDVLTEIAAELSAGKHRRIHDRSELWVLLISIIDEHVVRQRDDRQEQVERYADELPLTDYLHSCDHDLELMLSKGNKYGSLQAILEQMEDLIAIVKDKQSKEIAALKLQGHSNREIGARLGIVAKTVDRKVHKIVTRWKYYLDNRDPSC